MKLVANHRQTDMMAYRAAIAAKSIQPEIDEKNMAAFILRKEKMKIVYNAMCLISVGRNVFTKFIINIRYF